MKSASITDLDALIRFAQRSSLDDVCKVLDDPADNDDGIRWAVTLSRDTRFASIYFLERHGICELISVHWLIAEPAEAWRIRR